MKRLFFIFSIGIILSSAFYAFADVEEMVIVKNVEIPKKLEKFVTDKADVKTLELFKAWAQNYEAGVKANEDCSYGNYCMLDSCTYHDPGIKESERLSNVAESFPDSSQLVSQPLSIHWWNHHGINFTSEEMREVFNYVDHKSKRYIPEMDFTYTGGSIKNQIIQVLHQFNTQWDVSLGMYYDDFAESANEMGISYKEFKKSESVDIHQKKISFLKKRWDRLSKIQKRCNEHFLSILESEKSFPDEDMKKLEFMVNAMVNGKTRILCNDLEFLQFIKYFALKGYEISIYPSETENYINAAKIVISPDGERIEEDIVSFSVK